MVVAMPSKKNNNISPYTVTLFNQLTHCLLTIQLPNPISAAISADLDSKSQWSASKARGEIAVREEFPNAVCLCTWLWIPGSVDSLRYLTSELFFINSFSSTYALSFIRSSSALPQSSATRIGSWIGLERRHVACPFSLLLTMAAPLYSLYMRLIWVKRSCTLST